MSRVPRLLWFVVIGCGIAAAQNSSPASGGLEILKRASQQYEDAQSYDIQAIEEDNFGNELQHQWQKTLLEGAESPGGRFHYEGHSGYGSEIQVSDGANVWTYDVDGRAYTKKAAAAFPPANAIIGLTEGQTVFRAKALRRELADFASHYKSAMRLSDANIDVNGRPVECYTIRVTHADAKRSDDESYQETIWIDKSSNLYVKRSSHANGWILANANRIPQNRDITISYINTLVGVPLSQTLFAFNAPKDAKLLDEFPNPFENNMAPSLKGQLLPELKLVTSKGERISRDLLMGKAVVIDIWATWCAPCVSGLEPLSAIYKEGRDKGLTLITIDQDEEAATAEAMLSRKGYDWMNVHDPGEITKALGGTNGIPRTIVVNREGKVVYDRTAGSETELRKAIAALGPEFASLAPKPEAQPCGTQVSAKVN